MHFLSQLQAYKALYKHFLLFTILVGLPYSNVQAQRLSLNELSILCKKKNWEEINQALFAKGWVFFDSKKGDDTRYHEIQWSFEKDMWTDKAKGWVRLYCFDEFPNKIHYTIFNKESYTLIQNALLPAGYKLIKSEIEDGVVHSQYSNPEFIVNISTERRARDDYDESSLTAYEIQIVKKASEFDPDNGKKTYYDDNGQLELEATLVSGKLHGPYKAYHPNGNLRREGSFNHGIENGVFKEYTVDGGLAAVYEMKQGKKHGKLTTYLEGNKISEVFHYDQDVKSGPFLDYYYDEETGELSYKVVGNYKNNEKDGKWQTVVLDAGKERLYSFETFKDGLKEGVQQDVIGDTVAVYSLENGELHGEARYFTDFSVDEDRTWVNSDTSKLSLIQQVSYKEGVLHGPFHALNSLGYLITVGEYYEGEQTGEWKYYLFAGHDLRNPNYANALLQRKENYKGGKLHGKYEEFFRLGDECSIVNENYKLAKKCSKSDAEPITLRIDFKEGIREGAYEFRDVNGLVSAGFLKADLEDGPWTIRVDDTDASGASILYQKGSYKEGKRTGKWEQVGVSGESEFTMNYLNGSFHGDVIHWKAPGHPISKWTYFFGDIIAFVRYDELGMREEEKYEILDKLKDGFRFRHTIDVGTNSASTEYWLPYVGDFDINELEVLLDEATSGPSPKAIRDGVVEYRNEKGGKIIEGKFVKNVIAGIWFFYDYDQNVRLEHQYENGQLTAETYYSMNGSFYTGEYVVISDDGKVKEIRKVKDGLRNGKTIHLDASTGKTLKKEVFKKGKLKD